MFTNWRTDLQLLAAGTVDTYGLPYDFFSAMHYPKFESLSTNGQPIMKPKARFGVGEDEIGQLQELSSLDTEHINMRYCAGKSNTLHMLSSISTLHLKGHLYTFSICSSPRTKLKTFS